MIKASSEDHAFRWLRTGTAGSLVCGHRPGLMRAPRRNPPQEPVPADAAARPAAAPSRPVAHAWTGVPVEGRPAYPNAARARTRIPGSHCAIDQEPQPAPRESATSGPPSTRSRRPGPVHPARQRGGTGRKPGRLRRWRQSPHPVQGTAGTGAGAAAGKPGRGRSALPGAADNQPRWRASNSRTWARSGSDGGARRPTRWEKRSGS